MIPYVVPTYFPNYANAMCLTCGPAHGKTWLLFSVYSDHCWKKVDWVGWLLGASNMKERAIPGDCFRKKSLDFRVLSRRTAKVLLNVADFNEMMKPNSDNRKRKARFVDPKVEFHLTLKNHLRGLFGVVVICSGEIDRLTKSQWSYNGTRLACQHSKGCLQYR